MGCMRCGKETKEKNVFCAECLEDMKRYPVKPGTVIHIPVRRESEEKPLSRKKELTAEEQLVIARKNNDTLKIWLICVTTVAVLLGTLLYFSVTTSLFREQEQNPQIPNYTSVIPE